MDDVSFISRDFRLKEQERIIVFDANSSPLGRLCRLLLFPFSWVLFGKAKL